MRLRAHPLCGPVGSQVGWEVVASVLTIAKLRQWSVRYYNDTSRAAQSAAMDRRSANGGLGEYYTEGETRGAVWMVAGDAAAAAGLVGLSDEQCAGGVADLDVVARWLDDGVAPNGASGRRFAERHNHGFDLTFCAPKSVSVLRAVDTTGVVSKAVAEAHTAGIAAALEYLHRHAGYTRVHNPETGMKDLQRLPGLVAAAYQHETSRAGDPHLHTHVLVPNRQARADGTLVAIDSDSLWHEARAAGVIYQATLRRRVWELAGLEWEAVDAHSGMAEIAGVDRAVLAAASQRSTQLHQWATEHLVVGESVTAAQLASAQKATRPKKPEHRPWAELREEWVGRFGEVVIDPVAQSVAREARAAAGRVSATEVVAAAVGGITRSAFTRADLVEALGARLPVIVDAAPADPLELVEALAERATVRITDPRAAHEREGHERYTAAPMIAEEIAVWEMIGARDAAAVFDTAAVVDTAGLSEDQARAVAAVAASPWLVQVITAPAGAGKTTSLRALREAAHAGGIGRVMVVAPTGRAVDVALAEGAADTGATVAAVLADIRAGRGQQLDAATLLLVDEAGMVGTPALRELLAAATGAGAKTVLVGDAHQLAPVRSRGGMFAELVADLPWAQHLSAVWRMADPGERDASLAIRDGDGAQLARAVGWYRDAGRLHTGDPVTMAADALAAWTADRAGGADALLIADRWEIADALNERIHRDTVAADAPTITGARRCRIGVGDVVISRRNDPTIEVYIRAGHGAPLSLIEDAPVRNGQRWRVEKIDPAGDRIAVRRIGDQALSVFTGDYLHRHVHHGYAITVHAAQGTTADRCHAVLSAGGRRSSAYVAMTRGRQANHVYLCEQIAGEQDHEHTPTPVAGVHPARRGDAADAATTLLELLGRDEPHRTAGGTAADTDRAGLPAAVVELLDARTHALAQVRAAHEEHTQAAARAQTAAVLVGRTADLQAAVEVFVCAAGARSGATGYANPVADPAAGHGLDESTRQVVGAVTTSIRSVHPLRGADPGQRAAIIEAVAAAAGQAGHPTWLAQTTTTTAAEVETACQRAGVSVMDPAEALTAMAGRENKLRVGGVLIVENAEALPTEALTALCLRAGASNTKLLLFSDPAADGPSRDLTDTLAGLPWAHHLGPTPPTPGIVERAAAWTATHPPAGDIDTVQAGQEELPGWLRNALTVAAEHRSPAVIGRRPARSVLADDLDARRAVERIALSPTTVHTLDLHTNAGGQDKAAVIGALARTGGPGVQMAVIPIGPPGAAGQATELPYRRFLLDGKTAADVLYRRTWKPPPGSRIVLDGADHLTTNSLTWWLNTAARHDLKLVLITDRAHPGPQRHLIDTLGAAAPWAAHHLGSTADTGHQAATTTVGRLVQAHTGLITAHHDAERANAEQIERYRRQERTRARDRSRGRDDGYDLSL